MLRGYLEEARDRAVQRAQDRVRRLQEENEIIHKDHRQLAEYQEKEQCLKESKKKRLLEGLDEMKEQN